MPKSLSLETIKKVKQAAYDAWDSGIYTKTAIKNHIVSEVDIAPATVWRLLNGGNKSTSAKCPPIYEELQERERSKKNAALAVRDSKMVQEFKGRMEKVLDKYRSLLEPKMELMERALTDDPPEFVDDEISWRIKNLKELGVSPKQMREMLDLLSDLKSGTHFGSTPKVHPAGTNVNINVSSGSGVVGVDAQATRAAILAGDTQKRKMIVDSIRSHVSDVTDPETEPIDLESDEYIVEE